MERDSYIITDKYVLFLNSFLSNWYPCKIRWCDNEFHSSEQLFMYLKAQLFDDIKSMEKIKNCSSPAEAKVLGRNVKPFHPTLWEDRKKIAMRISVYQKFEQNPKLKELFLSPKFDGKEFVEGNPKDTIWGVGLHYKDEKIKNKKNWKGLNLLGKTLGDVRMLLQTQSPQLF